MRQTAAARAASITRGALLFRRDLKQGKIKPDATKAGALCMDSYRYVVHGFVQECYLTSWDSWMFDCCRVPGAEGLDWSVSHSKNTDVDSPHVIFIRKNRLWKVEVTKDQRILSTSELEASVTNIYLNFTDPNSVKSLGFTIRRPKNTLR